MTPNPKNLIGRLLDSIRLHGPDLSVRGTVRAADKNEVDPELDMPLEAIRRFAEQGNIPDDQATLCRDCGIDAWAIEEDGARVHEDFFVADELWDATCPDDDVVRWVGRDGTHFGMGHFVLCIGCFERRLGRELTLRDFMGEERYASMPVEEREWRAAEGPNDLFGSAPSTRYLDRWGTLP